MKKTLLFSLAACLVFFMTSCGDGFEETETGLIYKLHEHSEDSAKPAEGDILFLKLIVKTESADSVLFSSEEVNKREGLPYFEMLAKPTFEGDYSEILNLMHVGDSATIKIDADTFFHNVFKIDSLPSFVESGSKVIVDVKLTKFMTMDNFKVYFNKIQAEKDAKEIVLENKRIADFVAARGITAKPTASGLIFIETKKGTGKKVENGLIASINYTGMFLDSIPFDGSEGREPLQVPVGQGMVIPAWEEALLLMNEGSKASIIVPYRLAYGARGYRPVIPPYATLLFEMEVVKLEKMPAQPQGGMPQGGAQQGNPPPQPK
ncbi:MAG: FKBP-type peptidyl-prolyl cis-trans isomerase [Sphingobacteriales bacterium JAD_PAG50586_3]|nr:MAG: FKBP-type peptidyl-prolyl cis-trans isomerase [Sphingobacteriales bacterium JAD_PAG50586_3]